MSIEFIDTSAAALAALPVEPAFSPMLRSAPLDGEQLLIGALSSSHAGGVDYDGILLAERDPDLLPFDPVHSGDQPAPEDEDPIVVVGKRPNTASDNAGGWDSTVYVRNGYVYDLERVPSEGGGGDLTVISAPADQLVVEITVNIDPITPEQAVVIEKFKAAVERIGDAIAKLDPRAELKLPNGQIVTGAELKAIWSETDFVINPARTPYAESARGQADYNFGDPVISFNIDLVEGWNAHGEAGLNFVIAHDLGYLTEAARDYYELIRADGKTEEYERSSRERMANDIARAINFAAGLPYVLNGVEDGWGSIDPFPFTLPTGDPETGGGGEDGGGGRVGRTL